MICTALQLLIGLLIRSLRRIGGNVSRNPNRQRGLTGAAILSAGDGDHADGLVAGLFLRVCGCAASWVYRYRSPTSMRVTKAGQPVRRTRELGLGSAMRESETAAEKAANTARAAGCIRRHMG